MKRRGFTLLEMMTVVAIIGVMASVAVINFRDQIDRARARGAAKSFARTISDTRLRAMTMACTFGVQINGPQYYPTTVPTGMIKARNTIIVYRKANCDGTVPNLFYEPGDKIIATQLYDPTGSQVRWPPSVLSAPSIMDDDAVIITYRTVGGVLRREVLVDEGNTGNFNLAGGAVGLPVEAIIFPKGGGGSAQERASIPDRGPAYVP